MFITAFIHRKARLQKAAWVTFCLVSLVAAVNASPLEYAENTFDTATPGPAPADASASEVVPVSSSPTSTQDQENAQVHSEALLAFSSSQTHTSDAYSRSSSPVSISSSFVGSILPTPNARDSMPWVPGLVKKRLRSRGSISPPPRIPQELPPPPQKLPGPPSISEGSSRVVSGDKEGDDRVGEEGEASAEYEWQAYEHAAACVSQCRTNAAYWATCKGVWDLQCVCESPGKDIFQKVVDWCLRLCHPPAEQVQALANQIQSDACAAATSSYPSSYA